MVGHISCRTGIPGIKNIADHIRLILAGNKENKILRSKQKAAGHGYAFLPIIGIDTHLIRMKGRKQIFLPRKDRGGMPASPAPSKTTSKAGKPPQSGTVRQTSVE